MDAYIKHILVLRVGLYLFCICVWANHTFISWAFNQMNGNLTEPATNSSIFWDITTNWLLSFTFQKVWLREKLPRRMFGHKGKEIRWNGRKLSTTKLNNLYVQNILWRIHPLLGNIRGTHAAGNRGAVFSILKQICGLWQRTSHSKVVILNPLLATVMTSWWGSRQWRLPHLSVACRHYRSMIRCREWRRSH